MRFFQSNEKKDEHLASFSLKLRFFVAAAVGMCFGGPWDLRIDSGDGVTMVKRREFSEDTGTWTFFWHSRAMVYPKPACKWILLFMLGVFFFGLKSLNHPYYFKRQPFFLGGARKKHRDGRMDTWHGSEKRKCFRNWHKRDLADPKGRRVHEGFKRSEHNYMICRFLSFFSWSCEILKRNWDFGIEKEELSLWPSFFDGQLRL